MSDSKRMKRAKKDDAAIARVKRASLKQFTVYLPVICSEIYHVEAENESDALAIVKAQEAHCLGEICTGQEDRGERAVEGWK